MGELAKILEAVMANFNYEDIKNKESRRKKSLIYWTNCVRLYLWNYW